MNPKDRIGSKKVSTFCVPDAALFHLGTALMDGARKYGAYNWRDEAIQASIYLDAIQRHRALYAAGEDVADDSKVKHLAHIMGCCAILIDAELHGKLIDDRKVSPQFIAEMKRITEWAKDNGDQEAALATAAADIVPLKKTVVKANCTCLVLRHAPELKCSSYNECVKTV